MRNERSVCRNLGAPIRLLLLFAGLPSLQVWAGIVGRVVADDGSSPPPGVQVLSSCRHVVTARDGSFWFSDPEIRSSVLPCELIVALPGFRSFRGPLPKSLPVWIRLRRVGSEGNLPQAIDRRVLECLPRIGQTYGKGEAAMGLRDWGTAVKWLKKTLEICPAHTSAWDELGLALEAQGHIEEARGAYKKSMETDPRFARPLIHLAGLAFASEQYKEAFDLAERALRLDARGTPRAWFFHGAASFQMGRFEIAEESIRRAVESDGASDHLRAFLKLAPKDEHAAFARQVLAKIEIPGR